MTSRISGMINVRIALKLNLLSKIRKRSTIPQAKLFANSYWLVSGTLPDAIPLITSAAVCARNPP